MLARLPWLLAVATAALAAPAVASSVAFDVEACTPMPEGGCPGAEGEVDPNGLACLAELGVLPLECLAAQCTLDLPPSRCEGPGFWVHAHL